MAVVYLTSIAPREGKTAFGAALGKKALDQGRKVGYFKPFPSSDAASIGQAADPDAEFFRSFFKLSESADALGPLPGGASSVAIKTAYDRVAHGKELMIVEGPGTMDDNVVAQSQEFAGALNAQVIYVSGYCWDMDPMQIAAAAKKYGKNLLGVLFNGVPQVSMHRVQTEVVPYLEDSGLKVLGAIPEERTMLGFTVGELAAQLNGKFLTNQDKAGQLVENVMVGVLTLDNSVPYFERYAKKAVIVRGDRPDVQWATLDTNTSCMVATSNKEPIAYVIEKSQNTGVPIIQVETETLDTLSKAAPLVERANPRNPEKIARYADALARNCNLAYIQSKLGLA